MKSLRKAELIAEIAERANLTKADANRALTALQDTVIEAVVDEKRVSLTGFASFTPSVQSARNGRNPRTGEKIFIPERRGVLIRPLKAFKDALQESN